MNLADGWKIVREHDSTTPVPVDQLDVLMGGAPAPDIPAYPAGAGDHHPA